MKCLKNFGGCVSVVALCLTLCAVAEGAGREPFLAEAESFGVQAFVQANEPTGLITSRQVQAHAELLCRKSLLSPKPQSLCMLIIHVKLVSVSFANLRTPVGYAYAVSMETAQIAKTASQERQRVLTWQYPTHIGVCETESLRATVNGVVEDGIVQFANAWLASHDD